MTEVLSEVEKKTIQQYERHKEIMREYSKKRYNENEYVKEKQKQYTREYMKNRYQNDEEYRNRVIAQKKELYKKKKALRLIAMEKLNSDAKQEKI